ncbi:hypothetical protein D3C87_2140110 [compost metagenome]
MPAPVAMILFSLSIKGLASFMIASLFRIQSTSVHKIKGYFVELMPVLEASALLFLFSLSTTKSLEYTGFVDL